MRIASVWKLIIAFALLSATGVVLAGCSGKSSSIIPSTSPLPSNVRGSIATTGGDCQFRLLGFLPLGGPPNTQEALKEAKARIDVDVLTDVTIDHTSRYWILFGNSCTYVRGMGVPREVTNQILPTMRERDL